MKYNINDIKALRRFMAYAHEESKAYGDSELTEHISCALNKLKQLSALPQNTREVSSTKSKQ